MTHPLAVLLVDDDATDRLLTRYLFKGIHAVSYVITDASTYEAALELMLKGRFDVCLVDYHLGLHSGLDLLREALEGGCNAPVILLTGSGDPRVDETAMRLGAADYLVKDQITPDLLERVIRHAIERAGIQQALRDSEERFRLLVDGVNDHAIFLLTPTGHVASWNAGAERLTGYTEPQIIGEHVSRFHTRSDCDRGWPAELLHAAQVQGTAHEEAWRMHKDGSPFWAETTVTALKDNVGQLRGYAKVVRNNTERRRADEQRDALVREQAARVEAEAASRARDEFLAIVSHELKTPLTSIVGYIKLILRRLEDNTGWDAAALKGHLTVVDHQNAKMVRLVNALLDLSRMRLGRLELECEAVDLTRLVADVVDAARLQTKDHTFAFHMPERLVATVDPMRLEQVVTNLLDNAVKYSPQGGQIEMDVSTLSADSVCIAVRDHGLGIPEETRGHVFEQFFRGHQTDYRSGMGIGLYISQQIVRLHGGHISVDCPADGGTRFAVVLPTAVSIASAPARPNAHFPNAHR